jgi:ABC-type Fe3+-hydroxamate transport system, periplasmic component
VRAKVVSKLKKTPLILGVMFVCLFSFIQCQIKASPKILKLKYAQHFKIEYIENGCKKVTDANGNQLLLVARGHQLPKDYRNIPVIHTPIRRALFASMTQVCLLRPFHNRKIWASVVGVTSPLRDWYIPEIREGLQNGSVQFIGDGYEPDYERIQALRPEIVFTYGGPDGQMNLMQKLSELKILYAVDNEYLETDPLGQMEWIKFIAAFYDQEQTAAEYLAQAETRIADISKKLQGKRRPKIAWGMIYNGKAYVPAADSYVAKMIRLAGGDYIFKQLVRANSALSIEAFYIQSKNADILINSSYASAVPSIKAMLDSAPILQDLKAVRNKQVWCLQPWYNQMVDQNDQILLDLAAMFHPEIIKNRPIQNFFKTRP